MNASPIESLLPPPLRRRLLLTRDTEVPRDLVLPAVLLLRARPFAADLVVAFLAMSIVSS
jgi:hypothetical protein